jgi:hypothetical protein
MKESDIMGVIEASKSKKKVASIWALL